MRGTDGGPCSGQQGSGAAAPGASQLQPQLRRRAAPRTPGRQGSGGGSWLDQDAPHGRQAGRSARPPACPLPTSRRSLLVYLAVVPRARRLSVHLGLLHVPPWLLGPAQQLVLSTCAFAAGRRLLCRTPATATTRPRQHRRRRPPARSSLPRRSPSSTPSSSSSSGAAAAARRRARQRLRRSRPWT